MPMPTSSPSQAISAATARPIGAAAQPVMAIVLGMFIVGMAGFSHLEVVHNAAHDARHSSAFPCH